ncbi:gluconokinase [Flavihumibacter petaseus]|uniref:Gluconokinase n=1 Tax=Flavihumibacter petaseus NBRC 106054 TaxID=1220578 RepID=A0A0E9N0A6_9BACT|nr:FGGY family carbohydrate kinase [Flavihumibacter petaseus]GAO43427.1 gluconokinase [Flavihumibacter petaseus NBRC 106054]
MPMRYFAGLDIGTTHTKLIVTDEQLHVVFQAKKGYELGHGARLDAPEILSHSIYLVEAALLQLPAAAESLVIGCSAAMHSLLLCDDQGAALSTLQTWADNSSQPILPRLREDREVAVFFAVTGTPLHPMSPFCKLAWLRQQHPALLDHAAKCVGIKEYLWYHLTGYWEIDTSLASATGLFSLADQYWHLPAVLKAGIRPDQLSLPVPATHIRQPLANLLPALHKVDYPVSLVIGGSDGCLAQLGSGILSPGAAALTIGTSGAIRITRKQLWTDEEQKLFTYILDGDYCVIGGATNNGGIALQWWQEAVAIKPGDPGAVLTDFNQALLRTPAGAGGLTCVPWFWGERAPVWDAEATGIFAGVTSSHEQVHFQRAMVEGICFGFRKLLQHLERAGGSIHTIAASGGFTASEAWLTTMADILRRPVEITAEGVDKSALGAIAMAMKASGQLDSLEAFAALTDAGTRRFLPNQETQLLYDKQFQYYSRLCQC